MSGQRESHATRYPVEYTDVKQNMVFEFGAVPNLLQGLVNSEGQR